MSRAPVIGVLALQGDVREHERALGASGAEPVRVRDVAQLADLDALVAEPITFTGAAVDQVEAVVRRAVHLATAEPQAAAYDPGAIL